MTILYERLTFSLDLIACIILNCLPSSLLQRFDAVLTDPMVPTGSLIARKLGERTNVGLNIWFIYLYVCLYVAYG